VGIIRTYNELISLRTFDERFDYLKLNGKVSDLTFGLERYLNQEFYKSAIWLRTRRDIIVRDLGCDIGVQGYEIYKNIIIHHINPITKEDILQKSYCLVDPDNLICNCLTTHNAIHYGNKNPNIITDRHTGDTCLWDIKRR